MRLARYVKPGESSDGDGDEGDEEEGYDCQLLDSVEHEPVSINVADRQSSKPLSEQWCGLLHKGIVGVIWNSAV